MNTSRKRDLPQMHWHDNDVPHHAAKTMASRNIRCAMLSR